MFTVGQKTLLFPTISQRRCGLVLIGLDHLQLAVTIRAMFACRICCTEAVTRRLFWLPLCNSEGIRVASLTRGRPDHLSVTLC